MFSGVRSSQRASPLTNGRWLQISVVSVIFVKSILLSVISLSFLLVIPSSLLMKFTSSLRYKRYNSSMLRMFRPISLGRKGWGKLPVSIPDFSSIVLTALYLLESSKTANSDCSLLKFMPVSLLLPFLLEGCHSMNDSDRYLARLPWRTSTYESLPYLLSLLPIIFLSSLNPSLLRKARFNILTSLSRVCSCLRRLTSTLSPARYFFSLSGISLTDNPYSNWSFLSNSFLSPKGIIFPDLTSEKNRCRLWYLSMMMLSAVFLLFV